MNSFWLRAAIALAGFSTISVVSYALGSAPVTPPSYLGIRGLRRLRMQRSSSLFAALEPLLRWLGSKLRPLLSEPLRLRIERQLTLSGDFWGLLAEECCALSLLSMGFGLSTGASYAALLKRGPLYAILGGVVGLMLPYLQLTSIEHERKKQVQNGLPYVIDLLSLGLSAGLDFPAALRQIVDKSSDTKGALVEEIHLMLQELEIGKTRRQALTQFAERTPIESVREFVGAMIQADARGNPLGPVLEIQADVSRQRRSTRAEEAASRASIQLLLPMVLVFAAILLLIVAPMFLKLSDTFQTQ